MRFTGKMLKEYVNNHNKNAGDVYPRVELRVFGGYYHIWTVGEQWRIADEERPIEALHKMQMFMDGIRWYYQTH
mgnify:CR=1 FL=1